MKTVWDQPADGGALCLQDQITKSTKEQNEPKEKPNERCGMEVGKVYKPKIFLMGKDKNELIALEETSYVSEGVLQDLLVKYPDLLPGDQIDPENPRRWLLVARELGVPGDIDGSDRWSLDHLFLDQDGIPTFVECKRATDTRTRREVVAQMLDYAANGTEYWTMDRLRQAAAETAQRLGDTLDDAIAKLVGDREEIDIEEYWQRVETNLRNRHVRLIFVADRTPKELRRLVEFLNEEMANVEVLAVEIKQFQREDKEKQKALVPRVVGLTETARTGKKASSARKKWSEDEFFQVLSEKVEPGVVGVVRDLYEWGQNTADRIWWGTGTQTGSFLFHYLRQDKSIISVFSITTNGRIWLNYGQLSGQGRIDQETLEQFHRKITEIPTFRDIPADFSAWHSVKVADVFKEPEHLARFKQAVEWLGERTVHVTQASGTTHQEMSD